MSVAIRLRQIEKTFPNGLRALTPIDMDIEAGEFTTLLGPSGCGKSTLLRVIAGLLRQSAGQVEVEQATVGASRGADIAFVFQNATLMPWATVAANVRLPLELAGQRDDDRLGHALEQVGLTEFADAYPRELSGGMQMRVSIARALVTRPRLLLMDEPFAALDEITRQRLDSDLRSLWSREHLTVLFVTHSIHEAVFLSNRVVVMSARPGRLLGEEHIDANRDRDDDFRLTTDFARHARRLSDLLTQGATAGVS